MKGSHQNNFVKADYYYINHQFPECLKFWKPMRLKYYEPQEHSRNLKNPSNHIGSIPVGN